MSIESITVEGSGQEYDVKLDTWLRDLTPLTPGCVPSVRRRELILACREFFEQSACWRGVIGPRQMKAGRKRYMLSPVDAYTDVVHVLGVQFNGEWLRPLPQQPRGDSTSSTPRGYWLEAPDVVRLWPVPQVTVEAALRFYVAMTPKQTVRQMPRIAATHYYDAILDGAAGRLLRHPAKPYTNPVAAEYHLRRFRAAIGKHAAQGKSGHTGAPSWVFPRFGK